MIGSAKTGASSKPVATIVVIGLLSLATWYLFQAVSMPLAPSETTFVVGGWVIVVLLAKWLWSFLYRNSRNSKSTVKSRAKR